MGYEFELKFSATPERQAAVLSELSADWQTIAMETTYYDTADSALSARHYTLRRRLENGISVCTLKTPAGPLGRGEWELECDSIEGAIPELCKLGGPAELAELTRGGLIAVCGAKFTRRAARVEAEGTALEIAVDQGVLFGGGREETLCEIEIELKSGSRDTAVAYAESFAAAYGLIPQPKSKFRRALELKEGVNHG